MRALREEQEQEALKLQPRREFHGIIASQTHSGSCRDGGRGEDWQCWLMSFVQHWGAREMN